MIRFRPVGWDDLPSCRWRGRAKGEKASPLAIPGPGLCRLSGKPLAPGRSPPPGATRHPWRDAPFCGHPDRAPATAAPSTGPADGFGFGCHCNEQELVAPDARQTALGLGVIATGKSWLRLMPSRRLRV